MNKSTALIVASAVSAVLAGTTVVAEEAHHPDADKTGPTTKSPARSMDKMQEQMMKMHDLMHKIRDTKDPKERERLMQQHQGLMREQMQMMHNMRGMGGGRGMGGMGDKDDKMPMQGMPEERNKPGQAPAR